MFHPAGLKPDQGVGQKPTTGAEPATSGHPECKSTQSEAVELKPTPSEAPELEPEMMPGASREPSKPLLVDPENGQIKKNDHLAGPPELDSEQILLTHAVSGGAGQGRARHTSDLFSQDRAFPDPES
jgi:hypothetical protein